MSSLSRPLADPFLPAESSGDILPLERLDAELARTGLSYWRSLKGPAPFPPCASMMSCLSPRMRAHSVLIEVLDGGADYEYRSAGEAMAKAFHGDFSGRRLSGLIAILPKFGLSLRMMYEMVRASGEPLGYRGWVGNDLPRAAFVYHESVFLPLGEDGVVDHLLAVVTVLHRPDDAA
jgi:hypothetical protein